MDFADGFSKNLCVFTDVNNTDSSGLGMRIELTTAMGSWRILRVRDLWTLEKYCGNSLK